MTTMKSIVVLLFISLYAMPSSAQVETDFLQLSADLLHAVKRSQSVVVFQQHLAQADLDQLIHQLDDDTKRKTFWINVYNSFIILNLREDPSLYDNRVSRSGFFTKKRMTIAGQEMSFDDIEHGILRHSKIKLSGGYLDKPFVSDLEKALRVETVDWRIHFALNCGAGSCPPIDIYEATTLDAQLDRRAEAYLRQGTVYQAEDNKVSVTTLMSWFRGDFGGMDGIREVLRRYQLIPADAKPSIEFQDYDWTLDLDNYAADGTTPHP